MVSLSAALSAYGLYQYFYEMPAAREFYEQNPEEAMRGAGLWYEPGSEARELYEQRLSSVEPLSTFALTNSLAGFLAPWLVVCLGMGVSLLAHPGREDRLLAGAPSDGPCIGARGRVGALWALAGVPCVAVLVGLCLMLTKSRSAYLATLVGIVLLALSACSWGRLRRGMVVVVGLAGLLLVVAAALAAGGLDLQVLSEAAKSLGYRVQYWKASLGMIAEHPWVGCGPGNFQDCYPAYKLPTASEEIADPHNFLLEIWATAGTFALLAFVTALAAFYFVLGRAWLRGAAAGGSSEVVETQRPCAAGKPRHLGRFWDRLFQGESDLAGTARRKSSWGEVARGDRPECVFGGAAAGYMLGIVLGFMSEAPPGLMPLFIGLPCAVVAAFSLFRWADGGELPLMLPAIGVTVLLVNLLAAGALALPGVAGTLWILMALGLTGIEKFPARRLPRGAAFGLLASGAVLAALCYSTAYGPVVRSRAALARAAENPRQAEQHLAEAVMADPLWAEPWSQLASLDYSRWEASGDAAAFQAFEMSSRAAITRRPSSSRLWWTLGERYFAAASRAGGGKTLPQAVAAYRRAVELYPNSANYQAGLALALRAAGDSVGYGEHRDQALWLDEVTPHADKKLRSELRKSLERNDSAQK